MYKLFVNGIALLLLFVSVAAQQSNEVEKEEMEIWQKAARPGEQHSLMKNFAGDWNVTGLFYNRDRPDDKPGELKGKATRTFVLGGRFLRQEFKGTLFEMPFSGIGYNGYDNVKKQFLMTWIDNMSTTISSATGTVDSSGKIFTYFGDVDDLRTGEMNKMIKYVERMTDKDTYIFEVYEMPGTAEEFKSFQLTYKRVK